MKNALQRRRLNEFADPARPGVAGEEADVCPRSRPASSTRPTQPRARRERSAVRSPVPAEAATCCSTASSSARAPGGGGADPDGRPGHGVRFRAQGADHVEPARWLTPTSIRAALLRAARRRWRRPADRSAAGEADRGRRGACHLRRATERGGKMLLVGNGGSAADAAAPRRRAGRALPARRAARCRRSRSPQRGGVLGDRQRLRLRRGVRPPGARPRPAGDVAVGLSTSGGSAQRPGRPARRARPRAGRPSAVTGRSGHRLAELSDHCVAVPADRDPADPGRHHARRCTPSASWSSTSSSRERRTAFLDRDGTINVKAPGGRLRHIRGRLRVPARCRAGRAAAGRRRRGA